ncbi:TPA: DUF1642 domain-containing protein [Streptococcus suis]|nr:DUF1642 domain-containing protein [Streptococcus suis]
MNKQEAIEKLTNIANGTGWVTCTSACNIISQIDQPQTVVVPKFVAEWLKEYRHASPLLKVLNAAEDGRVVPSAVNDWILDNQRDFVVAWYDGYEIEQEKLYTVELFNGQPLVEVNNILHFSSDLAASNAHVSKDKLEKAGFGWVFDCSGVKVVEVE